MLRKLATAAALATVLASCAVSAQVIGLPGLICTNSNHRDWEQGAGYGKEKAHT
jgi:hypothetical protein